MPQIRFQTAKSGEYLLNQLRKSGILHKVLHDGVDIILFEDHQQRRVSVHFIDSSIETYEIYNTLKDNAANDTATLFMLWSVMMLPEHGQTYHPEPWMAALSRLYEGLIYGYDVIDGQAYLFPVYFRGESYLKQVEYGTTIPINQFEVVETQTVIKGERSTWRIVTFAHTRSDATGKIVINANLLPHYERLGIPADADEDTVKRAYRLLARRYHPDTNKSENATEHMQEINVAYKAILDALQA